MVADGYLWLSLMPQFLVLSKFLVPSIPLQRLVTSRAEKPHLQHHPQEMLSFSQATSCGTGESRALPEPYPIPWDAADSHPTFCIRQRPRQHWGNFSWINLGTVCLGFCLISSGMSQVRDGPRIKWILCHPRAERVNFCASLPSSLRTLAGTEHLSVAMAAVHLKGMTG